MRNLVKFSIVAAVASVSFSAGSSQAGTVTWDGGSGGTGTSWNDPVNWAGDTLPTSADTANFTNYGGTGVSTTKTITLDAPQSIYQLNIPDWANTPNFTIGSAADVTAGNTLTLARLYRGDNLSNTLTIGANIVLSQDSLWTVYKGYNGGVTVNGAISGSGKNLTVLVPNGGSLIFAGKNTYTGATVLNNGTLNLSFANNSSNILSTSSTLSMGGGTLNLSGKASTTNSQTVAGLTLNPGASTISISNNATANPTLLALGAITRNAGGTLNLTQPTNGSISSTNGYTTSTGNDASGILGAYLTVGGTNWATNNGTNIVAYSGYANLATPSIPDSATSNVRVTSATTGDVAQAATVTTINTLTINDATARVITIGAGNTLRLGAMGGILSTGTNGATIGASGNAGSLTAGGADNTAGELVFNNSTAVALNATVTDNGSGQVSFTKSGAGTLTMNGAHSFTGGTFVNAGTLSLTAASNPLSTSGNITVSGGTMSFAAGSTQTTSGAVVFRGGTLSGGTLTKTGTNYDGQGGTVSTILAGSVGVTKTGPGTLALTGANTYTGDTVVLEGTLTASSAIGGNLIVGSVSGGNPASYSQSNAPFNSAKNLTVYSNGSVNLGSSAQSLNGTVQVIGGSLSGGQIYQYVNVTLTGGTYGGTAWGNVNSFDTLASATTSVISANLQSNQATKTFTVADGAAATDLIFSGAIANGAFAKAGNGLMLISASQGYTGATSVNAGTLVIGAGGNINNSSSITVNNDAIFRYEGTTALTKIPTLNNTSTFIYNSSAKLGGALTVSSGRTLGGSGTFAAVTVNGLLSPGNSPGQMTVDSLLLGSTSTTHMEIGGATLGTQYDNLTIANSAGLTYGGKLEIVSYSPYTISAQAGSYNLFSFTGGYSGELSNVTVDGYALTNNSGIWTGSSNGANYTFTDSTGIFAVTIPEPATASLMLGVISLGLMSRRRRQMH